MKPNQGIMRRRNASCVRRHKQAIVETQPATGVAVYGDPHEEEFDFGPHVSIRLDQKPANFKLAFASRIMQWSALTEEKQKNELAQIEFRLIKTINIQ
jgi:hypothetical protein